MGGIYQGEEIFKSLRLHDRTLPIPCHFLQKRGEEIVLSAAKPFSHTSGFRDPFIEIVSSFDHSLHTSLQILCHNFDI
jgi:hypothetical protein